MPAGIAIGIGAIGGAVISADAAGDAADAGVSASNAGIAEQRRQFDTLLSLTSNQRAIGNQALNELGGIYGYQPAPGYSNSEYNITGGVNELRSAQPVLVGDAELPPGTTTKHVGNNWYAVYYGDQYIGSLRPGGPNGRFRNETGTDINALWANWEESQKRARAETAGTYEVGEDGVARAVPNYSAFYESPDYQFRLREGTQAVQNSAAAQGGLYSGNALRAISDYAQGTAAGEYGNYFNRQLALAGMGQAATTQAGNAALTTGANIGNLLVGQGDSRASGITGQANAISGGINQLSQLYGLYQGGFFNRPVANSGTLANNYGGSRYGGYA